MNKNLVPCKICEKKISNKAIICPSCGEIYPTNKNGRKIMKVLHVLEIGIIVFYVIIGIVIISIPYYIESLFQF